MNGHLCGARKRNRGTENFRVSRGSSSIALGKERCKSALISGTFSFFDLKIDDLRENFQKMENIFLSGKIYPLPIYATYKNGDLTILQSRKAISDICFFVGFPLENHNFRRGNPLRSG
jgi:hypothetical protein